MSKEQPFLQPPSPAEDDDPLIPFPIMAPETQPLSLDPAISVPLDISALSEDVEEIRSNESANLTDAPDQEEEGSRKAADPSEPAVAYAEVQENPDPTAPILTPKHKEKNHQHNSSANLNSNPDGLSAPFQSALARRFDKVPVVWGKDLLPISPSKFQSRLKERLAQAETLRVADQHSKEPSAGMTADSDKQIKPERENKYRPAINMYRRKPVVSEEQMTELIWGSYEQRTIDLFFSCEQARQSSELSHILERITKIEGVKAFIIFDIYENEKYPPESDDYENIFEEDENGFPVKREEKLRLVDGKWEIPVHIIYTSTDLNTAKKIIPFTKQLIWRLVETTRDLDPKNDVRYLRLISDVNEIVVMPMFPRHFLIVVQEPKSSPNLLFENLGLVTTHPVSAGKDELKRRQPKPKTAHQKGPLSALS